MRRLLLIPGITIVAVLVLAPPAWAAWVWPVDGEVITPYRNGDDPYAAGQHRGIDIASEVGTLVVAAAGGEVRFAGTAGSSGLTVSIRTADGRLDTSYLHLSSVAVRKGDRVETGQPLGAVGVTGTRSASAAHLHFGVRDAGSQHTYHDPLAFLPPPGAAPEAPREAPGPQAAPVTPTPAPQPAPVGVPRNRRVPAGRRVPARRRVPATRREPARRRVPGERRVPAGRRLPAERRLRPHAPVPTRHPVPADQPRPALPGPIARPAPAPTRAPVPTRAPHGGPGRAHAPGERARPGIGHAPGRAARDLRARPSSPSDAASPAARRRTPAAHEGGRDLGLVLACLGLVLAAVLLGLTEDGRKATRRGRDQVAGLVRPLLGRR